MANMPTPTIPFPTYGAGAEEGGAYLVDAAARSLTVIREQSQHILGLVQDALPKDLAGQLVAGAGALGLVGVTGVLGYQLLKAVDSKPEDKPKPAEKKPPLDPILIIRQGPRGRTVPSISPWGLKLETFLRAWNIEHEVTLDVNFFAKRKSGPGVRPVIILDLEEMTDHRAAVANLCDFFNLNPRKHLTKKECSLENAFMCLIDHHLYWGLSLWRWVYDEGKAIKQVQNLNAVAREAIPVIAHEVEKRAWHLGIGKQCRREVIKQSFRDLFSLSRQLGDKKFFFNDIAPTELDCSAFGVLAQIVWAMPGNPFLSVMTETYPNLIHFCDRMRADYWKDWNVHLWAAPVIKRQPFMTSVLPKISIGLAKSLNQLHDKIEEEFGSIENTVVRDLKSLQNLRTQSVETKKQVLDQNFERDTKIMNEFLKGERDSLNP